jgi:hypothetical protein
VILSHTTTTSLLPLPLFGKIFLKRRLKPAPLLKDRRDGLCDVQEVHVAVPGRDEGEANGHAVLAFEAGEVYDWRS